MSAAVAVDYSHMTVLSSTSWSRFSPSSNFVNGHVTGETPFVQVSMKWAWPVQKRFIADHIHVIFAIIAKNKKNENKKMLWSTYEATYDMRHN